MQRNDVEKRLINLRRALQRHAHLYHALDAPEISDAAYDALLSELRELEAAHPRLVTPDSPTQRVGGAVQEQFNKVDHPAPVLSLSNAFGADDVRVWHERVRKLLPPYTSVQFVVEPKIDGLTVVLHYQDGVFDLGATRGNGEVGEDITLNLRTIATLPLRIPLDPEARPAPERLVVRGEAYMPTKDFQALNRSQEEKGERCFANPRNAAAGSLRQLDSSVTASRPLSLFVYSVVSSEGLALRTQWEALHYLAEMGFPVNPDQALFEDLEEAIAHCERWMAERDTLPYEVDGLVIKVNDLATQAELGVVGKDPRAMVALKFPAREATTQLKELGINVGRTGTLTPFAILEPTTLGGVTIQRATLHNFEDIARKDIRIGDTVVIKRAGDVIPQVERPIIELRSGAEEVITSPTLCPVCKEQVVKPEGEVAVYCVNPSCPAQLVQRIVHWASTMDIEGFGERMAQLFVNHGLLHDPADLYLLDRQAVVELPGLAEKSTDKLLEAIQGSRTRPLARVIAALGIRGVGSTVAALLATQYHSVSALSRATVQELQSIHGMGPIGAANITAFFANSSSQQFLARLQSAGVQLEERPRDSAGVGALAGLAFVITGSLPTWTREQATQIIETHGGRVTGSVSRRTSYLLLGDTPGSKHEKARELGIPTINEMQLRALIEPRSSEQNREHSPHS